MDLMKTIPELKIPDEKFTYNDIKNVSHFTKGVYFIYDFENKLVYIGKSTNIKNRMFTHFKNHNEYEWFKYIKIKDDFDLEIYETYFINKFKPQNNKDKKYKENRTKRKSRIIIKDDENEQNELNQECPSDLFMKKMIEVNKEKSIQKQLRFRNELRGKFPQDYRLYMIMQMDKL